MRILALFFIGLCVYGSTGCSPVKSINNEFQLSMYSAKSYSTTAHPISILVTKPDAIAGYDTSDMLYTIKPFKIESFAENAWLSPPADMLYSLITQSLQRSGFFFAVANSPYSEATNYRLDTQLMRLQQNFIVKPSRIELVAKVVLTDINKNQVLGSALISRQVNCSVNDPYGGVLAANKATEQLTAEITKFVISHLGRS